MRTSIAMLMLMVSATPALAGSVYGTVRVNELGEPTVARLPLVADEGTPEGLIELALAWKGEEVQLLGARNHPTYFERNWPLLFANKGRYEGSFSPHQIEYPSQHSGEYDLTRLGSDVVLIDKGGRLYELLGPLAESAANSTGAQRMSVQGYMFLASDSASASQRKFGGRVWVSAWRPQGNQTWLEASEPSSSQALEALAAAKPERPTLRADLVWEPVSRQPALLDVTNGDYLRIHELSETAVPWLLFYGRTVTVERAAGQAPGPLMADSTGWVAVERVVSPTRQDLRGRITDGGRALITSEGRVTLAVVPDHPGPSTGAKQIRLDTLRLLESLAERDVAVTGWVFHLESGSIGEVLVSGILARFKATGLPVKVYGLDLQGRLLATHAGRRGLDRVPPETVEFTPDTILADTSSAEPTNDTPGGVLGVKDLLPGQR